MCTVVPIVGHGHRRAQTAQAILALVERRAAFVNVVCGEPAGSASQTVLIDWPGASGR